jgi:tetratricopeptide (TPR) repeat protein
VSQSPAAETRRPRYEAGWEAINRMIRESGSWSGRERNCLHLGGARGRFIDASAASGIDFIEDGRAWAVLDLEGDGDADLLVRSRNGPRLRVLRNEFPALAGGARPRSIVFDLEGPRGGAGRVTADAAGARVELVGPSGRRIAYRKLGHGFLSQHGAGVRFGVGDGRGPFSARVRWPDARLDDLRSVEAGRRYRLRHGEGVVAVEPLVPGRADAAARPAAPAPSPPPPRSSPRASTWLLDPLPAGVLPLRQSGDEGSLRRFLGRPLVLAFLSASCALCQAHQRDLGEAAHRFRDVGAAMLGAWVDGEGVAVPALPFPTVACDPQSLLAWNVLHRQLWSRHRDLAVPLTFLINREGAIERAYRGPVPAATLLEDLARLPLPRSPRERLDLALPRAGSVAGADFHRDLFLLGAAFVEARLPGPALAVLEAHLAGAPDDAEAHYNLGVISAELGDRQRAEAAYRRALDLQPQLVEAINNLGFLDARAGRLAEARARFEAVLERQPEHTEALLNLAATRLQEGRPDEAIAVYDRGLARDPGNALFWSARGYALFLAGENSAALSSYRQALSLDALQPDAVAGAANLLILAGGSSDLDEAARLIGGGLREAPDHLPLLNAAGQLLIARGRLDDARAAFERALERHPGEPMLLLNLALCLAALGDRARALAVLDLLEERQPGHPQARRLRAELGR